MNVFSFVSSIFKPVADLVDYVTTTDEERLEIKYKMLTAEAQISSKVLEYETKLLESKTNIILAESNGKSWLQRNWRPITMMCFLLVVLGDSFGLIDIPDKRADSIYALLQIGLGGYVVGRSAEKIAPQFTRKN